MTKLRRLISALLVGLLMAGLTAAQGPERSSKSAGNSNLDEQSALSVDVDLVVLDVVVTEKHDSPITGLRKEQFIVLEDGVPQNITHFSPTEASLTVVILVEFSNTIGYYLDDVLGPAAGFIQSLRPDDWGALVKFDIRPEILVDFTKDRESLLKGLQRLDAPGFSETSL
jgi:VWFA-related protein